MSLSVCSGCRPVAPTAAESTPKVEVSTVTSVAPPQTSSVGPVQPGPVRFRFLSPQESGIDFLYYGNPSPEHYMTEQNGGGVALLDFDGDGALDVFLVNGSHFDRPADPSKETNRLYRNSRSAEGKVHFSEISHHSRLAFSGFGMGAAGGDYDNDGFCDLFVCYYGEDHLWHNNGDGTFEEVTATARTTDPAWSASAAFADLDADGDLDLYVANYVIYESSDPPCFTQHQTPVKISCGPIGRTGEADRLWENLGDGTFADASKKAGLLAGEPGKGLAVEAVDLDGDDQLDLFVANDTSSSFLFHNQGHLQFEEIATVAGVAVSADGAPGSSMGIACADFDHNGRPDLFVTNFENATNDYFDNRYESTFVHRSNEMGLDTPSRPMLAFGTVAADFDLDGWPDLFVANGHIWDLRSLNFGHLYEMPPQLFYNQQGKRFLDVSQRAGEYFQRQWLGRAVAKGDLDSDGDVDLVVTHELQSASVLLNVSPLQGRSTVLRLIGTTSAREPLGIKVTYQAGSKTNIEHVPAGGSFQSSHAAQIVLSCGHADLLESVSVHWGPGRIETWHNVPAGLEIILTEGKSKWGAVPLRSARKAADLKQE